MVNSEISLDLGRSANVARLIVVMPPMHDPIPSLLDATIAGMANTGFVLSRIEFIGDRAFAQSWRCRLE